MTKIRNPRFGVPDGAPPSRPVPLEITDILDLHCFAPRDSSEVVKTYLEEARAKGFATVRIIHGKGIGAQRAMVHTVLKRTEFVGSYQDAPAEAGGWGATIVWFRSRAAHAASAKPELPD